MNKFLLLESLVLLILSSLGIYEGFRLSGVALRNIDHVGPGWYLLIVSALIFVCTLLYVFTQRRREVRPTRPEEKSFSIGPVGWMIIVIVIYAIATPLVGYTVATAFFFVVAFYVSGVNSWLKSIVLGLVFTVAFKYLFSDLAGISFP